MSDNKLTSVSVSLKFKSSSGYSAATTFDSKSEGSPPVVTAKAAIEELARIVAIDGDGQGAIDAVTAAVARVDAWRAEKAKG